MTHIFYFNQFILAPLHLLTEIKYIHRFLSNKEDKDEEILKIRYSGVKVFKLICVDANFSWYFQVKIL